MIAEVRNGCLNCLKLYSVTEVDDNGRPLHVHYCDDCTKTCKQCHRVLLITRFLPNRESNGFKEWQRSATEHAGPLGLLTGRENYLDFCMNCKPHPDAPVIEARSPKLFVVTGGAELVEDKSEEDVFIRLQKLLASAGT